MSLVAETTFDSAWQLLSPGPSPDDLLSVLELQLDFPSFAVPVAHPAQEGAKAYAQVLFVPASAMADAVPALQELQEEGRILFVRGLENGTLSDHVMSCPYNLTAIFVLRPDDPARS